MGQRGPPKVMKNGSCSTTTLPGSTALPFVISTGVERSAVQRSLLGNVFRQSEAHRRRRLVPVLDAVIEASPVCRLVGLNSKQVGQNAALLRRELCLKLA